jgi:N-acylneuraminate cytidylyltransferase
MLPLIDRIVISTDSEQTAAIGLAYGAEVPFLRPAQFAGDRSPDRDFVLHALQWFNDNEGVMPDYLVHLRPTTPLRHPSLVQEAIRAMIANPEATSLRSGHVSPESPFKWFTRDEKGYFCPIVPVPRPGDSNLPRQGFPQVYIPDGYVDVLRTSFVVAALDIHGPRVMGYVSPTCREVDTPEDFEFLEFQIVRSGHPLLHVLKKHHPREET